MSPDRGASWYDFNRGLWDATQVMDLALTRDRKIVAATHGKGAFISDVFSSNLPITLVSFTGSNQGDFNNLRWITAVEENADHFELERSFEGSEFTRIANVPAKNSSTGATYVYDDDVTNIKTAEAIFYRLKMVDKDESFEYSNVVSIRMPLRNNIIVKGNPFQERIRIQLTATQKDYLHMNLYDESGRKVASKSINVIPGLNELLWDNLSLLPSGNYVLELKSSQERFSQKVIKGGERSNR